MFILPVAVQAPLAGLNNSALAKLGKVPEPPATSTWPLGKSVAVKFSRAVFILPVAVQVPLAGLYNSALDKYSEFPSPPTTSTWPLGKSVAV